MISDLLNEEFIEQNHEGLRAYFKEQAREFEFSRCIPENADLLKKPNSGKRSRVL